MAYRLCRFVIAQISLNCLASLDHDVKEDYTVSLHRPLLSLATSWVPSRCVPFLDRSSACLDFSALSCGSLSVCLATPKPSAPSPEGGRISRTPQFPAPR